MTVIAYDGATLSADKRAINSGLIRTTTKIHRLSDGSIVAYAGQLTSGLEMVKWIENGKKDSDFPKCQTDDDSFATTVHLAKAGLFVYETSTIPMKFEDKFFACGSGRDFAVAAMYCGKTSTEAVEIASRFDNGCGNGVDSMQLETKKKGKK